MDLFDLSFSLSLQPLVGSESSSGPGGHRHLQRVPQCRMRLREMLIQTSVHRVGIPPLAVVHRLYAK